MTYDPHISLIWNQFLCFTHLECNSCNRKQNPHILFVFEDWCAGLQGYLIFFMLGYLLNPSDTKYYWRACLHWYINIYFERNKDILMSLQAQNCLLTKGLMPVCTAH